MKAFRLPLCVIAALMVLSIITVSCTDGLSSNSTQIGSSTRLSERGQINVAIQTGAGYTVKEGTLSVASGADVQFTVEPKEGYRIIGFSYSDFETLGNNVYKFKNVLYPTVIEVYYTSDNVTSSGDEKDPVTNTTTQSSSVGTDGVTSEKPSTTVRTETVTNGTQTPPVTSVTTAPDHDRPQIDGPTNDIAYANSIIYCFNGGTYDGYTDVHEMTVFPNITNHQRVNVFNGKDLLYRNGYTLIGWNTAPDGSGTHVSLGSRCTLNKNGALMLYAEWVKWSDLSDFTYELSSGKARITAYGGDDEILCIPAELDGYSVAELKAGAFKGLSCTKVILPDTIRTVQDGAFTDCALEVLHFFDTVTEINDGSFVDCDDFSTLYINQYLDPVYIKSNGKVEAYDSLILSEKKSIVFFAGSSVLYGIDAYRATASFEGTEYDVINLGWTAPRNAIFQMQIITGLLEEGDIFIHAPEYISSYHLLRSVSMGTTAWQVIDCNLDLYSYVDIRTVPNSITSFCAFSKAKAASKNKYTYDAYCSSMDFLGYKCSNRPIIHDTDWAPDGSCKITSSLITDTSISRMRTVYSAMEAKGAKVYLSYPPLNENYIAEGSRDTQVRQGYIDRLKSVGYTVIGTPDDFFYDGSYFHDTEFHLVTVGAQMHTDKIINMLKDQMIKDGLLQNQ